MPMGQQPPMQAGAPPGGPGGAPPSPAGGQPPQGGGGGGISDLMSKLGGGLDVVQKALMGSQQVSPQSKALIGKINQMFDQLMDTLSAEPSQGGGDDQGAPGAQGQTTPMEAGGNKGAMPVG